MVGTQRPKSKPPMVEAWKPPKVPVTASLTAPAPTAGAEQTRVWPEPVQVPDAAFDAEEVATEAALETAVEPPTAAMEVEAETLAAWKLLATALILWQVFRILTAEASTVTVTGGAQSELVETAARVTCRVLELLRQI